MRRRALLATSGGLLANSLAGCLSAVRRDAEPSPPETERIPSGTWPQVGYDARNTRHTPDAQGPRDDATVAWSQFDDRPVHPPVVADGVYLTEARTDGAALALAADDGAIQWENETLPPVRWAPALDEERLFVVSREEGNVVRLHALSFATGEETWVREEGFTASSRSDPPISPTVRGDTVYVGSNRGIVACDATTGDVRWTATLGPHVVETEGGPTWRTDWTKPAVTADRAFTFDLTERYGLTREVYAVDTRTGDQSWTAELEVGDDWELQGYPVVGEDHVFVSALRPHTSLLGVDSEWSGAERLFALERDSGAVAWDWKLTGKTLSPPAYADGTLFVGEWYPDPNVGRLHAVDAESGDIQWTYRTVVGSVVSPTVTPETVYIGEGRGVAAVDRSEGTRRWRLPVDGLVGPPVVVGETIYLQWNPRRERRSRLLAIRAP